MNENYVRIGGGLTRDPKEIPTRTGMPMAGLTVAVNGTKYNAETRQQEVTTQYISVVAFGPVAEHVFALDLARGDAVVVEGSLSQEEVEVDGRKDRKTRVEAWNLILVRQSRSHSTTQAGPDPWAQQGGGWGPPPTDQPPF